MYEKYPKRGAWTKAACLMTLIFHPVPADVYMLVHPHTLTVSWPLCALLVVTGHQPSTWSVGVFCVETRALSSTVSAVCTCAYGASHFLCVTVPCLCMGTIPCATPDDMCSMAQVVANLSRHPHYILVRLFVSQ